MALYLLRAAVEASINNLKERDEIDSLSAGDYVMYEIGMSRDGRPLAVNVEVERKTELPEFVQRGYDNNV
jgi:ERCC4-type nuclease